MAELGVMVASRQLAKLVIDPARIVGRGGALSPALQISFDGAASPQPPDSQVGVERITIELWLTQPKPPIQLGQPATKWWPGGSFSSTHRGIGTSYFDLHFALTFDEVRLLESVAAAIGPRSSNSSYAAM